MLAGEIKLAVRFAVKSRNEKNLSFQQSSKKQKKKSNQNKNWAKKTI